MVLALTFALPVADGTDLASSGAGWSADGADDTPGAPLGLPPVVALVACALVVVGAASTTVRPPRPSVAPRRSRLRAPPPPLGR
jgi:hypothetical protein